MTKRISYSLSEVGPLPVKTCYQRNRLKIGVVYNIFCLVTIGALVQAGLKEEVGEDAIHARDQIIYYTLAGVVGLIDVVGNISFIQEKYFEKKYFWDKLCCCFHPKSVDERNDFIGCDIKNYHGIQ